MILQAKLDPKGKTTPGPGKKSATPTTKPSPAPSTAPVATLAPQATTGPEKDGIENSLSHPSSPELSNGMSEVELAAAEKLYVDIFSSQVIFNNMYSYFFLTKKERKLRKAELAEIFNLIKMKDKKSIIKRLLRTNNTKASIVIIICYESYETFNILLDFFLSFFPSFSIKLKVYNI